MAVAILISTFGCNNGLILAGPRVYYAMARDRLFFERAGTLHPDAPHADFGLLAQAVWAMALCLSGTYGQLLDYVIFAALDVLPAHHRGALPAAAAAARPAATGEGVRLPGGAGAVHRLRSRSCWWCCWSTRQAEVLRLRAR